MNALCDLYLRRVKERIDRALDAECARRIAGKSWEGAGAWAPVCEPAKPARRYAVNWGAYAFTRDELEGK
jgi:hypothetical protein